MNFIYYPSNNFLKNQEKGEITTQQEIRDYDRLRRSICNEPYVIKNEDVVGFESYTKKLHTGRSEYIIKVKLNKVNLSTGDDYIEVFYSNEEQRDNCLKEVQNNIKNGDKQFYG
jgi:hypothetical protein